MRITIFIHLISMAFLADATTIHHKCMPSGHDELCILENVFYNFSDTTTRHSFSGNYSMVRIASYDQPKAIISLIPRFDALLYSWLGKPAVVEVALVKMEELEIPRSLRHGNFISNRLEWFSVEHGDNSSTPAVVFLDLSYNNIKDISNVSSLVNLEVLYLARNEIKNITSTALKPLTKLRYLSLSMNNIHQVSAQLYPTGLVELQLYYNEIESLNYTDLNFPELEVFDIERNDLGSIDVNALLLAMPKLTTMHIGGNRFREENLHSVITILQQHNISYKSEGEHPWWCYYDGDIVEGVCLRQNRESKGTALAIVFSILLVAVAIVFVLATRWVFLAMTK